MKKNNWFFNLLYSLPFSMKGGEKLINKEGNSSSNGQTINQEVSDERVAKHLLKGELTKSVKELRYRTYKVSNASNDFKYIGDGKVVKKNTKRNLHKINFSQTCKLLTANVLETLKEMDEGGADKYNLIISYSYPLVKFKFEEFATQIDVNIDNDNNDIYTTLHFSNVPDGYNSKSAPFINELKKLFDVFSKTKTLKDTNVINEIFSHNEMASTMQTLEFVTFKASNDEPDLMRYKFNLPMLYNMEESNYEITITFKWSSYNSDNLSDKFFDKTMDEKYNNKTRKNNIFDLLGDKDKVFFCDNCGKELTENDYDITKYTFGRPLCKDCLKNTLLSKE